jgi:pilus assembly protein Flp/PilA
MIFFVGNTVCEGTSGVMAMLRRLFLEDRGSNALEYGLIVGLISLAIATGATAAGSTLSGVFNTLHGQITNAVALLR